PQRRRRRLGDALRDRGLTEAISFSFTAPATLAQRRVPDGPIPLATPLSEDHSVMRPLLLPGLLDAAHHNATHGRPGAWLFESAHVYTTDGAGATDGGPPRGATPALERHHLGAVLAGSPPAGWRTPSPPSDFFACKALLEALLATARVSASFEPAPRPF